MKQFEMKHPADKLIIKESSEAEREEKQKLISIFLIFCLD